MSENIDDYTTDLTHIKLRLTDDLVFWPHRAQEHVTYRIESKKRHKFFTVGYEEYIFISLLDGNTTPAQACGLAAQALGREALTQQQAIAVVRWLLQNELAKTDAHPIGDASRPMPKDASGAGSLSRRLNPFWMKFPLVRSESALDKIASTMRWVFDVRTAMLSAVLITIASITVATQWDRFAASSQNIFSPSTWVWMLLTWVGLKVIHELGHASACRKFGGETTELGVVFILFAPLAYVDVTSSWRFNSRWKRIAVAAAGMYVELTVTAIAAITWGWTDSLILSNMLFNVIIAATATTVLFNANPLMRFDGYFILADLLDIPNLYTEGQHAVRNAASRFFFARSSTRYKATGWRRGFVSLYGILAMCWRIVVCVSLAIAAAYMFHGAGVILMAIGLSAWVVRPTMGVCKSIYSRLQLEPAAGLRALLLTGSVAVLLTSAVFYVPITTSICAPAIVDFVDESLVRARADGFVEVIHVSEGDHVQAGDVLLTLRNQELGQQLFDLRSQIRQSEIRQRTAAQKRDMATVQVEKQHRQSLQNRFHQVQVQSESLTIRAHRSGKLLARRLADRIGTYVNEGDELFVIAGGDDKQLVVSIAQEDIGQAAELVGKDVDIRSASRHHAIGTLARIQPLASTRIPHDALAAVNAGPLPVVQDEGVDEEKSFRLVEPRFQGIVDISLEHSKYLPVGQTVQTTIGLHHRTAYAWLRLHLDRMLKTARAS